jgi:YbbR domain-containing protein
MPPKVRFAGSCTYPGAAVERRTRLIKELPRPTVNGLPHFVVHTLGARFLFAFIAAVGLWVWRTELNAPGISVVPVNNAIPVEITGVRNGLIVIPQPNQNGVPTVAVQANVPTEKKNSVSSTWFRATIDVSGQTEPGTRQYPVTVVSLEPGVTPANVIPPSLAITLDTIATRSFPIQVQYQGTPPTGYQYSPAVLDNNTSKVSISGPETVLQQIATVIVVVRLDNRKASFHDVAPLVPENASFGDVSTQDLQLSPKTVGYSVSVQQTATTRNVAIVPPTTGQPAEGYVVAGITVDPNIATLVGNPSVLDTVPTSIGTDPVDVSNATADVTKTVAVQLPKDTSLVGDSHVKVTVQIKAIPSSVVLAVAPKVTGAGAATQVALSAGSINVTLQGPAATLKGLQPKDIGITINVTGLSAGTHIVTPIIDLPTGVTAQSITPDKVQVTIIPPTPTPTPTPPPTSTPTRTPAPTATPSPVGSPAAAGASAPTAVEPPASSTASPAGSRSATAPARPAA